jgi:thiamine biosynthesis protein ThiS
MSAMRLTVNDEELDFSSGNTVREFLAQLHLSGRPVAVERNGQIVPHSTFDQTELTEGDSLEVVTLVGGG